jgi:NTE family protein
MKAIVVSGGGSKGAWAGGVAQYLVEQGKHYDILTGTSTGSLLIPLIATEDFVKLKQAYTSVTSNSIFKVNPFKKNSADMSINVWAVIYNVVIRGQKTFGDSTPMIKLIQQFFSRQDYESIREQEKHVVACTSNLTKDRAEYYDIQHCTYADFCDWIRASASFTPFMSLVEKNGFGYADGGIFVPLPLQQAIDLGASDVDVIVLDPQKNKSNDQSTSNVFAIISSMMGSMDDELRANDVEIGSLLATDKDVNLNVYFTPTQLTQNSLSFDQIKMTQWWNDGYTFAKNCGPQIKTVVKKNK